MEVLYKYYSSAFDLLEHLNNPAIKLSSTRTFNDPFEREISRKSADEIMIDILELINPEDDERADFIAEKMKLIRGINSNYGVVSLTETHDNLLMWSHYASSHKGVCIGYNEDFFEKKRLHKNKFISNEEVLLYPYRIKYKRKMLDKHSSIKNKKLNEIIIQSMLIKSDEWIYEKEHRCIVPIEWADRFIVERNCDQYTRERILDMVQNECIKVDREGEKYSFMNGGKFTFYKDEITERYASKLNDISLLKDIDIESIRSIYFGASTNDKIIENTLTHLNNNHERYAHIKLYKYSANFEHFDLDLDVIR